MNTSQIYTQSQISKSQNIETKTERVLNPPFIPADTASIRVDVYRDPASTSTQATGYYVITVTRAPGPGGVVPPPETTIVSGQTMILMMGAFLTQKIEQGFTTLFTEVQARNDKIAAIQKLMPIIVQLQTLVPPVGPYTLPEPEKSIWEANAATAGLPPQHQDAIFNHADVTEILDTLQTNLSNETKASETQMMQLNTQASLRTTFFNLMQSNVSLFKQSLQAAANGG